MFSLAFLIGIYSYLVFGLGILGFLYRGNVQFLTLVFIASCLVIYRKKLQFKFLNLNLPLALITLLAFVNLVGALGPELGFDALWYHLTLPKIFLMNHRIFHIPGGLFYYSDMPKLVEMLYVGALSFGGETAAKIIHFSFGLLSAVALYKISIKVLNKKLAILSSLVFYSSLVVGWGSITAYVDLGRTFFETLALLGFINYIETKKKSWLVESSFMLGLGVSSKLLSLGSIPIFVLLLILEKEKIKNILTFLFIPFLTALPWLTIAFLNTGNPVYPFFTNIYKTGLDFNLINPIKFVSDLYVLFLKSADPLSPVYAIFIPILFFISGKLDKTTKIISIYSICAILIWYITPRTGGGRFVLPYLPALSVMAIKAYELISKDKLLFKVGYFLIIAVSIISVIYRGIANSKYIPVLLGIETKDEFLSSNLNFKYGDFYDTDGFFKKTIISSDAVLLYGFHNLYYINFPFIDSSYVKTGDKFNFIATQNTSLPERFKFWKEIYSNSKTGVKLYNFQGKTWLY